MFLQWDVTFASGGVYTIKSTYGHGFVSAKNPHEVSALNSSLTLLIYVDMIFKGDLVNTKSKGTPFQIKQVGGGKHVVCHILLFQ